MERIYVFIIRNDIWIYILCGLGLFWYVSELIRANRILRGAMFGMEWETGTHKRNSAMVYILILASIVGIVFYVNRNIAPTLPPELLRPPTPTPDIFATPLVSPTPLATQRPMPPTATIAVAPTVTLASAADAEFIDSSPTPDPVVAEVKTPASADVGENLDSAEPLSPAAASCTAGINISEPANRSTIDGEIQIIGSASTDNFDRYVLEIAGPQTEGQWASLLGRSINTPIEDGLLGNADFTDWLPGVYLLQVRVFSADGSTAGECAIQVLLIDN